MALQLANATVSLMSGSTPRLVAVDAHIGPPSARDLQQFGGIVRYVVLLNPLTSIDDCRESDELYIQSWGINPVDSTRPYYVIQSDPSGDDDDLAVQRVVVGIRKLS